VGALYLENNLVNEGFPEERVELLSILSSQAAISIENSRLYTDLEEKVEERTAQLMLALEGLEELATTDKLTGLYNRRKFEEVLTAEIIRIQRFEHPGSLIIFDIDNFKEVNDTFGHQAGDEVLKRLSATVKAWLRNVDTLARWGGDEYTILMPETDLKGATTLAEKIRLGVTVQKIPKAGMVTISLGVTEYRNGDSMESMLKRADEALYRAKRNGRDRVET
jgi:diguanylate cyclase (GGDEF)-like protein